MSVRLWDALTGIQLKVLSGHTSAVESVAFFNYGSQILSGSEDSTVRVWDVLTGGQIRRFDGHTGPVRSVALSRDDSRIVSASDDGTVRVWGKPNICRFLREFAEGHNMISVCTGWLRSPSGEGYLVYVPAEAQLPGESNILTIPPSAVASIDFTHAKLGTVWQECYKP